jgi:hypothetical protein
LRRSGRQAAAATGVVAEVTAAVLPTIMFDVDQPFVFVLRDTETGAILFVDGLSPITVSAGVGRRKIGWVKWNVEAAQIATID